MKNLNVFIAGLFLLILSIGANAQDKTSGNYFVGKWNLTVSGAPSEKSDIVVRLERKEGKLTGTINVGENGKPITFSKIEEKETSLTLYYTNKDGRDVYVNMFKKDENHVSGSIMNMYDIKGERVIK